MCLKMTKTFLRTSGSQMKPIFCFPGRSIAKTMFFGGSEVPDEVLQKPLHSVKCTAWVAMSKHGIIGPFGFEDDDGRSQTLYRFTCNEMVDVWNTSCESHKLTKSWQKYLKLWWMVFHKLNNVWLQFEINSSLIKATIEIFMGTHLFGSPCS